MRSHLRAGAFLVQAVGTGGLAARAAHRLHHREVEEHPVRLPTRHGALAGRVYRPVGAAQGVLVVFPGVNPAGVNDPRLVRFARALAQAGLAAVTAELPDLVRYRVSRTDVDRIEDAVRAVGARADLTGSRPPGVVGISFAGGLAVAAAGRPALAGHVASVLSLGGYGDLPRVLRFLCTGEHPDGTRARPHDYGLAVVLLNVLDRMVPPDQVDPLRQAVLAFMEASWLAVVDPPRAPEAFARARALEAHLAPPAAELMRWVNARDVAAAGPRLLPHALSVAADPALSPERSAPPQAPVFLIHGADDTVIPAQESIRLAAWLARRGVPVRVLVTPLVTHAEAAGRWRLREVWRLVSFWADVLDF